MATIVDPHFKDFRFNEKIRKGKLKQEKLKNKTTEKLTEEEKKESETLSDKAENHYLAPEVISEGLVVLNSTGEEYTGLCWPGT